VDAVPSSLDAADFPTPPLEIDRCAGFLLALFRAAVQLLAMRFDNYVCMISLRIGSRSIVVTPHATILEPDTIGIGNRVG
jgi:hypothetical protein